MIQYPPSVLASAAILLAYKQKTKKINGNAEADKKVEMYVNQTLGY